MEKECLSRYSIEKVIGNGSFGSVFLANEKTTSRKVALKICPSWSDAVANYLKNEILILSLIDNLYFPEFYHSEDHGSFSVISIEYCPGKTLLKYLQDRKKLDEETILNITKQIAQAMAYLHHHRIIHRDIKLDNIIISDDMKIKVCDFSFSIFVRENQPLTDFCGSIQYCSPEMIKQLPYNGQANDIWTFGICILKMAIGMDCFNEITGAKSITGYYTIFDDLIPSIKLRKLIKGMLTPTQNTRMKLDEIFVLLECDFPVFHEFQVKFSDPVIMEAMRKAKYEICNGNEIINNKETPEYYMYRMIMNKLYLKEEPNGSCGYLKERLAIIESILSTERNFFCCGQKTYIEFPFYEDVDVYEILEPLRYTYVIFPFSKERKVIEFPRKMVVIECTTKKSKWIAKTMKITLVCGDIDCFCDVISDIIGEYTKSIYMKNR